MSKTHQRKNYKPASSAKAAELLASSGTDLGSPLGFAGLDTTDGSFSPILRPILKKLSKKDAVTRKKAIKELHEFAESCDETELSDLWESWPRQYGKMILDEDPRVRLGSHGVLEVVSKRLGRKMEKGLLEVLPSWFLSRGDPASDAAAASQQAFYQAFPSPEKRARAATLVLAPFFQLCADLIYNRNPIPESKINPDIETGLQRLARLRKTSFSALLKFGEEYLTESNSLEIENLSSTLFWKRNNLWEIMSPKSCDNYVKAGFMKLLLWWLKAFSERGLDDQFPRCLPLVLNHIESSEPKLQTVAWEAWLLLTSTYTQKLWDSVNFERAVFPKFLAVLRKGLTGSSAALSPFLLPILSTFPSDFNSKENQHRWLDALYDGLLTLLETGRSGEIEGFIPGYIDCVIYCLRECGKNNDPCEQIFTSHVIRPLSDTFNKLAPEKSRFPLVELLVPGTIKAVDAGNKNEQSHLLKIFRETLEKQSISKSQAAIYGEIIALISDSSSPSISAMGCEIALERVNILLNNQTLIYLRIIDSFTRKCTTRPPAFFGQQHWLEENLLPRLASTNDEEELSLLMSIIIWTTKSIDILESIAKTKDIRIVTGLLSILLSKSHKNLITEWASTEGYSNLWKDLAENLLSHPQSTSSSTLCAVVVEWVPDLSTAIRSQMLHQFIEFARKTPVETSTTGFLQIQSLLSAIIISTEGDTPVLEELVAELFVLSCCTDTTKEFRNIWSVGIRKTCNRSEDSALSFISAVANRRQSEITRLNHELETIVVEVLLATLTSLHPGSSKVAVAVGREFLPSRTQLINQNENLENLANLYLVLDDILSTTDKCGDLDTEIEIPIASLRKQSLSQLRLYNALLAHCSDSLDFDISKVLWTLANKSLESQFSSDIHHDLASAEASLLDNLIYSPNSKNILLEMCRLAIEVESSVLMVGLARFVDMHSQINELPQVLEELATWDFPLEKLISVASLLPGNRDALMQRMIAEKVDRKRQLQAAFRLAGTADRDFRMKWLQTLLSAGQGILCLDRILEEAEPDASFKSDLFRFLSLIGSEVPSLEAQDRDMVLCSLVTALQQASEESTDILVVSAAVGFFCSVALAFRSLPNVSEECLTEWNQFFLDGCGARLVPLYFKYGGEMIARNTERTVHTMLSAPLTLKLSQSMTFLGLSNFQSLQLPLLLDPELDRKKYPADLQSLLVPLSRFLASSQSYLQISSWNIIQMWIEKVYELEMETETETQQETAEKIRQPPSFLLKLLEDCTNAVINKLDSVDGGDGEKRREELESVQTEMVGLLLSWDLLLQFFLRISPEKRPPSAAYLRNTGLHDQLLRILLSIIPERPPVSSWSENSSLVDPITFLANEHVTTSALVSLSCALYFRLVKTFPAAFRRWFTDLHSNTAKKLEKYTREHVSPLLVKQELSTLSESRNTLGDMQLTIRSTAQEVLAVYEVEDVRMELMIKLPQNYPIDKAQINFGDKVIVDNEKKRKWSLQLETFLSLQNGSLLDGIRMWKRNIDKHLEGVEDCMICMMTVHCRSYELPGVTCRQCKKRFHASCLYKWFSTNSTNSCPLCRTGFRS